MLTLSPDQMARIGAAHQQTTEPEWILKELRATFGVALSGQNNDFLRAEITACLRRCDTLDLRSNPDRLSFCFLDIAAFPGFKDSPRLPGIIAKCRETAASPDAIMMELARLAPSPFWLAVHDQTRAERERREMPR